MLKKSFAAACFALLMLCCMTPVRAAERKLTLMIYMCGSNLESSYGSASADIQEMLAAAPGLTDATVLLMTGGSTSWSTGYDASLTQISELGKRGTRVVWRSDAMNMGEPETLTQLLQYGTEKYPAQEYALIMWNHGGGPLEGVCWDELFSMDKLTLAELTGAITAAELPQKLSWIGFDACLMSSIEVACALAPHAEYMIASQETEPAFGWNYAFLSGIAEDASGLETGRRIVDAYFDGHEDATETLTLACLDLSKVDAVASTVETFFSTADGMNHALYTAVSGARMNAAGFGKGLKSFDDDGYDLVDLDDLIAHLSPLLPGAAELQSALDELVCYSRANIAEANGVSIYHPYLNKDKYLSQWQSSYDMLAISGKYAAYVKQFGSWLTGDALADWEMLTPYSTGFDENGREQLALQLSQEQTAEFAAAQLIILKQNVANNNTYSLIGTVPAQINENGLISASADWKSLYVLDAKGMKSGPLSYVLTQDSQIARHVFYRLDGSAYTEDRFPTIYYLEPVAESSEAKVTQIRAFDEVTQTYTNRISVDDMAVDSLELFALDYMLPEAGDDGVLPALEEWPANDDWISYFRVDADPGWHFAFLDGILTDDNLLALFSVTDTQQNTYCSLPISLRNPHRVPFTASSAQDGPDCQVTLSGYVTSVEDGEGVWLDFVITNLSDHDSKFSVRSLTFNGDRFVDYFDKSTEDGGVLPAGVSKTFSCFVSADDLVFLTDLYSVSAELAYYPDPDDYQSETFSLTFDLQNCSIAGITPRKDVLSETQQDGLRWQLLEITPDTYSGFKALLYLENNTDQPVQLFGTILANNIITYSLIGGSSVPAGCSYLLEAHVYNDAIISAIDGFSVIGGDLTDSYVLSQHVQQFYGMTEVRELTILLGYFNYDGNYTHSATLTVDPPFSITTDTEDDIIGMDRIFRLSEGEEASPDDLLTLADNEFYTVKLERAMVGEKNIALCLHITNNTDEVQVISYEDLCINGVLCEDAYLSSTSLYPRSTAVFCDTLGPSSFDDPLPDPNVSSFSMTFTSNLTGAKENATVTLSESVRFSQAGAVMLPPEKLTLTDAQNIPAPTPMPTWDGPVAIFMEEVHLPENAQQYSKTFSVQLTEEQQAKFDRSRMLILKEVEDGNLQMVSYQQANLQEDGLLTCTTSGMVLCVESLPDILVNTYHLALDDGTFELYNTMTVLTYGWHGWDPFFLAVHEFTLTADPIHHTARFTSVPVDGELPQDQAELREVQFPTCELLCTLESEGLPYFAEIANNRSDEWLYKHPCILMNNMPLQMALRPITAQDSFYVMFSVQNTDGTGYTLPAIPYMNAGE